MTLPEDLRELALIEDLNLSSNSFSSSSTIINPSIIFKALGQMPRLKRLNLSRNRFTAFHSELMMHLGSQVDFKLLQELDFGYNLVADEEDLMITSSLKSL